MLNIEEMFNYTPYYRYDFLGVYFNTQLRLLTSRSLAERVARRMNLADRLELQADADSSRISFLSRIKNVFSLSHWLSRGKRPEQTNPPEFVPPIDINTNFAFIVLAGLKIQPVEETRLVEVSYRSPFPVLAADIVNTLIEEFINYSVEMRYEATRQASEFLNKQIARLRDELAAKEKELQKYGEEKKLLFLNEKESSVVSKFAELNSAFTEAQIERIKKEAAYRELASLKVDSLPPYISNPVIQNLKAEYTRLKNEYDEKIKIFKPEYPDMVRLRARLDSVRQELEKEINQAVDAARSEYRAALARENSLKKLLERQREDVVKMNNNAILYNSLKIEVENKRNLLNSLIAKQNEALVSARLKGLRTSNIKIVDRALIPQSPIYPNPVRNVMLAFLLSLFVGVGLAFFLEFLDNTVKSPEDVEQLVDLPSLGLIPHVSATNGIKKSAYAHQYSYGEREGEELEEDGTLRNIELINYYYPNIAVAEDYRTIRTSILFSTLEEAPQAVAFTSALPQEGKSTTAVNTAVAFAQMDRRVILLDADLRKPRLHKVFENSNRIGLSSYLAGKSSLENIIQPTKIPGMDLIPCGLHPPNPAELLESRRFQQLIGLLKEDYDFVFVDSPPVLAVVDASVVSARVDGVVLVIRANKTTKKALWQSVETLKKAKAHILGVVFNEVRISRDGYYSPDYHGYLKGYYSSTK
jgi:capsular exopolysaccharide synthesis family protein